MRSLIFLILGAFLFMAVTCERPVEIAFPEQEPELVLISTFTPGEELQAQVSLTRGINDPLGADYPTNARIRLFEGEKFEQQLVFVQPAGGPPFFSTQNFEAEIEKTYFLQVDVPAFDRLIASTTLPRSTDLQSLRISESRATTLPDNIKQYDFNLSLDFDDPPGIRNYYHLKIFQQIEKFTILRNDTIISGVSSRELRFPTQENNNFQVVHYEGGLLLEDTPFDGETKSLSLPISVQVATDEELPGKIIAELRSVSEPYYLFYSSVSRQRLAPTSPVAEPIIIYNPIENGNGVFAAYSKEVDSVAIRNY
ncbi:MAG TPA: DUF4249 domain-containing protein [Saprospiraceae bacterium]|nr:DUF4249 domain-containing protein [Saprospiraceae bacterium]